MTASADKVQYILQTTLEQTLPLVKKGIFSQTQLQQIMKKRQKHQNNMLKKQYKVTDYLGSIQYEYELQRLRKFRVQSLSKLQQGVNPIYKKQSSSDFSIIKRAIRLWDRTMHKYKFQIKLWKQYISFTLAIKSKKHFYKAVTNALRFLPFQVSLWKIAASYQLQVGKNLWKGRKILLKGLKLVPQGQRNIQLAEFMLDYQIQFVKKLQNRQKILLKGQQGIKMIGQQQEQQSQEQDQQQFTSSIKLVQYDKVLIIIIEETIAKNVNNQSKQLTFSKIKNRLIKKIKQLREQQSQVVDIIKNKTISWLNQYQLQNQQQKIKKQIKEISLKQQYKPKISKPDSVQYWKQVIIDENCNLLGDKFNQSLNKMCLQPRKIQQIVGFALDVDDSSAINILISRKTQTKIPPNVLSKLLDYYPLIQSKQFKKYLYSQIDRWLQPEDLKQTQNLLQKIVKFNRQQNRIGQTPKILRRLSIYYKYDPEFIDKCYSMAE